ncbi:MAG: leukocidin family pore-forming toxin [Synergistaceae bacterium]|nr:leukocidin family pore-forming toxin [Synergistaceae bacterium]
MRATLTTEPGFKFDEIVRNYDKGDPPIYTQYNAGFTHYIINSAYIEGVKSDDMSKVLLIANLPRDSIPKNTTLTQSMGWTAGDKVGVSLSGTGSSINADISNSVSHNESISYVTQSWTLQNLCSISNPSFRALFDTEYNKGDTKYHSYHWYGDQDGWQNLIVNNDNKSRIDFTVEWVREVKKEFWQNNTIRIKANPVIGERFAYGWGKLWPGSFFGNVREINGQARTIEVKPQEGCIIPLTPPHIYASKRSFNAKPAGETLSFN